MKPLNKILKFFEGVENVHYVRSVERAKELEWQHYLLIEGLNIITLNWESLFFCG